MPERETLERARRDRAEGKSPSTQAGEFVREEMHHIREGKHGARNTKQAIAIGLSKARRAGVRLRPPRRGKASTRRQAQRDYAKGTRARSSRSQPDTFQGDNSRAEARIAQRGFTPGTGTPGAESSKPAFAAAAVASGQAGGANETGAEVKRIIHRATFCCTCNKTLQLRIGGSQFVATLNPQEKH